ncbi:sulfur carrier protein ThiS [Sphingobacterium sp. LRF_L2]|uniref:sulfur carrier protein ThiS n=1 Tax=Sphingobacterium sp. LRF_L2 TaxID=3369421 RepID=UPI003F63C991
MQIKLNNQNHYLHEPVPVSLQRALELLIPTLKPKGIAVALNQHVIPRSNWNDTFVKQHDELLIITATQGG